MRLFFYGIRIILLLLFLFILSLFIPHFHNEMEIFISPNMSHLEKLSSFSKVAYKFPGLFINPAKIKFGVYRIKKNCNYISVFKIISYNRQASLPFKVKNGMSLIQIKEEMLKNQNFRGKFPENISEGMIIPDTYHFAYGIQRSKAIQHMLQKSKAKRDKLWKEYYQESKKNRDDNELKVICYQRSKNNEFMSYHFTKWQNNPFMNYYQQNKTKSRNNELKSIYEIIDWKDDWFINYHLTKWEDNELKAIYHQWIEINIKDNQQKIGSCQSQIFKDEQEWIIFASILEKEGISYEDKRKIAGVILNRIKRKMRLEIDATAIYIKTSGRYDKKLRWNEIQSGKFDLDDGEIISYRSPYNTYRNKGFPPGPICNPSIESLSAALNPERHNYLYYRVIDGNKHVFSEDFEKHKSLMREKNDNKTSINSKNKKSG